MVLSGTHTAMSAVTPPVSLDITSLRSYAGLQTTYAAKGDDGDE